MTCLFDFCKISVVKKCNERKPSIYLEQHPTYLMVGSSVFALFVRTLKQEYTSLLSRQDSTHSFGSWFKKNKAPDSRQGQQCNQSRAESVFLQFVSFKFKSYLSSILGHRILHVIRVKLMRTYICAFKTSTFLLTCNTMMQDILLSHMYKRFNCKLRMLHASPGQTDQDEDE